MSLAKQAQEFDSCGVPIRYLVLGEGEAVILMHGFILSMGPNWIDGGLFDALSQDHRVVAFDLRGHGGSGKPHDPAKYGLEMIQDVPRLMDHLQIARAHVVGYSLGGTLALKLIEIAPQRLLSLVLGGAGWERDGQQWIGLAGLLESVKPNTPLSLYFWPNESGRPPREVVQMVDRNDPAALAALSRGMLHVSVTEDALRSARVPILAVFGENDPIQASGAAMQGVAKNFSMRVVPGLDHHTLAGSAEFRSALRRFLSDHKSPVS
jgi:pimeloyl-ACP methyl ester carboxylesterase